MPILVHYGELALKGRNRSLFENKLIENIEKSLSTRVTRLRGRLVIESDNGRDLLKNVFGIAWYAPVVRTEKKLEGIKQKVLQEVKERSGGIKTFGVFVKRADKEFPFNSVQLGDIVGNEIGEKLDLKVDLREPDLSVYIEIADEAFIFFEKVPGLGGFPVGVSGRVLSLLSGGIDSPAAAHLMMKRGCEVSFIHFHSFHRGKDVMQTKIRGIVEELSQYQTESRLYLVPYHPFHLSILKKGIQSSYEVVLFRRFMVRLSEGIALDDGYLALATGDSLGQVASQTIENLSVLTQSVSLPIFQPLISFDKQEIIELAKRINTYGLSIEPYKDCCSMIVNRPRTRINMRQIERFENILNLEKVIEDTIKLREVYTF